MGIPLFGQEHVDRYRETDGEEGHDWQCTTVLLLTTTGRNSGAKRTTPLIYQRHGDDYLVVASNGGGDPPIAGNRGRATSWASRRAASRTPGRCSSSRGPAAGPRATSGWRRSSTRTTSRSALAPLGELLIEAGELEEAAARLRHGLSLGAPGTAGVLHDLLDRDDERPPA